MRHPEVMALIGACFLMSAAHGEYYTFYSNYRVDNGYSKSSVNWLWVLGIVCEIRVFMWLPRWLSKVSMARIFLATFAIAVLRFSIIAWCITSLAWLIFARVLHAALSVRITPPQWRWCTAIFAVSIKRGQGIYIYNSMAFGEGGTWAVCMQGRHGTAWVHRQHS